MEEVVGSQQEAEKMEEAKVEENDEQLIKFMEIFSRLHINIPFVEALEKMRTYAKFMKELLTKKRKFKEEITIALTEECIAFITRKLLPNLKDLGSFTILYAIGKLTTKKYLCDIGANIKLMPLSMMRKIKGGECKPTRLSLQFVDKSIKRA